MKQFHSIFCEYTDFGKYAQVSISRADLAGDLLKSHKKKL